MRYTVEVAIRVDNIHFTTSVTATGGDIERAAIIAGERCAKALGGTHVMIDPNTLRRADVFRTTQWWTADAHTMTRDWRDEVLRRMELDELPTTDKLWAAAGGR